MNAPKTKKIKCNPRYKKLWVSHSKHTHTMWPLMSLHGMLLGLWQFPYLNNPDHQYCERKASALQTMHGTKTHPWATWFSIKKSQCSPPISSFNVALDNNLISLKNHCIILWTFYEGKLIDSLISCIYLSCIRTIPAFISHFSHGHFTPAQTMESSRFGQALSTLGLGWKLARKLLSNPWKL